MVDSKEGNLGFAHMSNALPNVLSHSQLLASASLLIFFSNSFKVTMPYWYDFLARPVCKL